MKRVFIFLFLTALTSAQTLQTRPEQPAVAPTAPRAMANNDPVYVKLRNVGIGPEVVHVKDFTLQRDAGVFKFASGAFYFLAPVNGKITGAVFIGDGSFSLVPPIAVEQRNLAIFTRGKPFDEQFSTAVFRFTDGTEQELRKGAVPDNTPAQGDPSALLAESQRNLRKELKDNLSARLLEDVLSSQPGGKFTAFIKGKHFSNKLEYDVDPHGALDVGPEEVGLMTWDENHFGVWAAFHYSREYQAGTANSDEQNATFSIQHQKLDTTIAKNAELSGTAETNITSRVDGLRVLPFDLFPALRVDSVNGEDGKPLSFIQEDKNEDADFAVILPRELKKGETYTLTTKYAGKGAVSNEGGGNYFPIARENWYPSQGFGQYSTYDMTFRVPKGMKMVATGNPDKEFTEGNQTISHWMSPVPEAVAGFNFGRFKEEDGKPMKQPYILETFANPDPPDMFAGLSGGTLGTMSTLGLMKKAMAEAQISVEIYTDFFGDAPYKRLAMTQQTAMNFGQSWPGLVYLPISYFLDSTVRHQLGFDDAVGYFKVVGPHEIAHQWWGHMVGFNSYRDQWMSEGFADMSASMFLQYVYTQHGLDEYHKFWADERRLLTEKNNMGFRPIDAGPVTLGYRLANSKTGFDVTRGLIYPKGAYILQMVRFMLRGDSGDPDARFKALMHDFTKTYANREASTEDFKAMLEKYMTPQMDMFGNHKMDWFFNEFVYGTEYPTYKFEHSFSTDANGDTVLNFKLSQSNVDKNFAMLVPVYLELDKGRVLRLGSASLLGNSSIEQHIPLRGLKEKPKNAVVAYYDDILGDIENK